MPCRASKTVALLEHGTVLFFNVFKCHLFLFKSSCRAKVDPTVLLALASHQPSVWLAILMPSGQFTQTSGSPLTRAWSRFQGVERWLRWRWGKSTREQHKMGLVVIETLGPTCIQSFQSTMWKQRVGMGHKYCRLCQGNTVPSFVVFRLLLGWWYAQKRCVYQRLKASNYLGCGQLLSHIQLNCPLFPQYVCPYMGFLHIQLGFCPKVGKSEAQLEAISPWWRDVLAMKISSKSMFLDQWYPRSSPHLKKSHPYPISSHIPSWGGGS